MDRRVTIERINIPMKQVFAGEEVKQAVSRSAPLAAALRSAGLTTSPRTLRQYLCLAGEERLGAPYLAQMEDIFARADETSPISIEDQYPWLKEDNWTLEMKDVSYWSVTAELAGGEPVKIKRICWQENRRTLWIEPEESAAPQSAAPQSAASQAFTASAVPIRTENRCALLLFIKNLLLNGEIDLTFLPAS